MRFDILHSIEYSYSRPVFLEPHDVRMRPRSCGYQTPEAFELQVTPTPAGKTNGVDADGNHLTRLWFTGEHQRLTISARSTTFTNRENPFDYLLRPEGHFLPLEYDEAESQLLAPARQRADYVSKSDPVADFAGRLRQAAGGELLSFLADLNQSLYAGFEVVRRDEGLPWAPEETLRLRHGACRDLAELFIDACRSVGVAARFVSGYQEGDTEQEKRDLHAWAEVYVPGGGWRGYDPTHGLAVANRHVAAAASVRAECAAAVIGTFRGTGATSTMQPMVQIQVSDSGRQQQRQSLSGA